MKKLAILIAALAIFLVGGPQVAMATPLLHDTIDTSSNPSYADPGGEYQYSYLINTGTIFTPGPGTGGVTLWGSVSNLSFGAYDNWLEIGLVAQNQADAALASGNPTSMNNQSAYFLVGKDNNGIYFEAGDYANCPQDYQTLGPNVTAFDFKFEVLPNAEGPGGTVRVTINSKTSAIEYGVDNISEFIGDFNNAYVVVHAFAQTSANPASSVHAEVNVVPLPSTLVLLGSGLAGLTFYRQRRAIGRKS